MAETPGSKPGQKKLMKKLKASQARNTAERLTRAAKGKMTPVSRMASALKDGGAKVNPAKYKPLGQVKKLPGTSIVRAQPRSLAVVKEGVRDVVKYSAPKTALATLGEGAAGAAKTGVRGMLGVAGRVAGPVGALIGMTRPAGEGSDKPSGPLMAGNRKMRERIGDMGVRKAMNKFSPSVKLTKLEVIKESPKATAAPAKKAPPAAKAKVVPVPKAKPGPSFSGNWKGATPTAMQARGGARVKGRSLADLLKKK